MKQLLLFFMLVALQTTSHAQVTMPSNEPLSASATAAPTLRFGYLSYQTALEAMPDYAVARRNLDDLRIKYDNEMKRVEDEFNSKYESFLEGQRDFAPSILQKRQIELHDLIEKNMAFKNEAKRLLEQAEKEALAPLKEKLAQAIKRIAVERNLAFVLNTDNNAVPFVNTEMGFDISAAVANVVK